MNEATIQTQLGNFLKHHPVPLNFVAELKLVDLQKQSNFRISQLQQHQKQFLIHDHPKSFYYKISDSPIFPGMKSRFTSKKPFDFLNLYNPTYYIAIAFYFPKTTKLVYFLPPQTLITHTKNLSQNTLHNLSHFIINLKTNSLQILPDAPGVIKNALKKY